MQLSKRKQKLAVAFLSEQARPLERAQYRFHFENAPVDVVLDELAAFQNPDGGFGNAIEPDLRTPQSTVMSTSVAFQVLREVRAPGDHPIVRGAVGYLLHTYNEERRTWPPTGPFVNDAPHAPWWHYSEKSAAHSGEGLANPRAEIVGYLFDYQALAPVSLLETLLTEVAAYLDTMPEQMEMHDLLCYARLTRTESLPAAAKNRMIDRLGRSAERTVAKDPAQWAGYGLKPLWLAPTPASPFAERFAEAIEANLDYEIELLPDDGAACPNWSWDDAAWADAEREWKGCLTLRMLLSMRQYGRLE